MLPLILGITIVFIFIFVFIQQNKNNRLPPGPARFPLIGSLPYLFLADRKSPAEALAKLAKTYGPIYTIQVGSVLNVVVNSYEALTQVAHSEDLLTHIDENDIWFLAKSNSTPIGLLFSLPDLWIKTRSVCQKLFRKYGFNTRTKTEQIVMEQFMEFCDELKQKFRQDGTIVLKMTDQFNSIFFNIVTTLVTGKKYLSSDTKMQRALQALDDFAMSIHFGGHISHLYPQLVPLFPNLTGYNELKTVCKKWKIVADEFIEEERKNLQLNPEADNVLAEFLQQVEAASELPEKDKDIYTYENLAATFQDLQLGGTEALAHLVKFFIRFLLPRPHVQKRLQLEVDEVLGNRLVTTIDIPKLTYVQAAVNELLRLGCGVMMAPRKLLKDSVIGGYKLPKGMSVTLNIWGGSTDPHIWKDPKDFNPSRFLSPDGTTLVNTEKIMSFGFGKRKCIGEQLARTSLTLVIATLVQQFSFHVDPNTGMPSEDDKFGFIRDTMPFFVLIQKR